MTVTEPQRERVLEWKVYERRTGKRDRLLAERLPLDKARALRDEDRSVRYVAVHRAR